MAINRNLVKLLIVILVLGMIVLPLLSAVVSADGETMPVFDFIKGMEETEYIITVFNKNIAITGNALENTEIKVNIYWNKPINKKSIVSKGKSWEENSNERNWILQKTLNCTVGASQTFALPAIIDMGNNKIEVIATNDEDTIPYEVEIEYIDKVEITEEISNKIIRNNNSSIELE